MRTLLCAAGATLLVAAGVPGQDTPAVMGRVFLDVNRNGAPDGGEPGIAGVTVSNQIDCVATGADGTYRLDSTRGFGYVTVSLPDTVDPASRSWRTVTAAAAPVDFALAPGAKADEFTFLHASDTHVNDQTLPRLLRVKEIVRERKPAFMIVTGDLVQDALRVGEQESRAQFELYTKTIAGFPVPVRSALGNHDIFGIERHRSKVEVGHPAYEKKMFRSYLGPNYFSFDYGGVHFVALDTVDVADLWYYAHVDQAQLDWLACDAAHVRERTPVVTFNHIPFVSTTPLIWGYTEGEGAMHSLIEVNGRKQYRHIVSNLRDVMARLTRLDWRLSLGGHVHMREINQLETTQGRLRFHTAASVIRQELEGITPVSGVTLYRVRRGIVDEGEFIPLDQPGPASK